jgi:methylmalonyl-CoA carboxyltransferase large subunit
MVQNVRVKDLLVILEDMKAQIAALSDRVTPLESGSKIPASAAVPAIKEAAKPAAPPAPAKHEITEEEILAVSAALGAYLGVRVNIRQMRLLSSSAWAQQGRVSIHAHIPYTH